MIYSSARGDAFKETNSSARDEKPKAPGCGRQRAHSSCAELLDSEEEPAQWGGFRGQHNWPATRWCEIRSNWIVSCVALVRKAGRGEPEQAADDNTNSDTEHRRDEDDLERLPTTGDHSFAELRIVGLLDQRLRAGKGGSKGQANKSGQLRDSA